VLVRALKTLEAALYVVAEKKTYDVFELTKEVRSRTCWNDELCLRISLLNLWFQI
jgi:hypothetical protein